MENEFVYEYENYDYTDTPDSGGDWAVTGESVDFGSVAEYDAAEDAGTAGITLDADDNVELFEKLDSLIESVNLSRSYGSLSDYYDTELGFTVFPDFDTYEYFIDIDADGHLWACATNNHYVPTACLEVYESYLGERLTAGEEEEAIPEPTEAELQTLEVLEGISGTLTMIKANQLEEYEATVAYQEEMLALQQEYTEGLREIGSILLVTTFFVALSCGNRFANSFFERMRAG